MPSANTIIGRIAVRVLPDTSTFREDARAKLDAVEKKLTVKVRLVPDDTGLAAEVKAMQEKARAAVGDLKIKTEVDTHASREALEMFQRELADLDFDIDPKIDPAASAKAKRDIANIADRITDLKLSIKPDMDERERLRVDRQIDELKHKADKIKANVKPNLDETASKSVMARLAILTRDRLATILVRVSKSSLTKARADIAETMGAISGLNTLRDLGNFGKALFTDFDQVALKTLTLLPIIAALSASLLASSANALALTSSLASMGGVLLGLPGILGGFAIGATVAFTALKNIKYVVPEVTKAWASIRDTINRNFWGQAAKPIRQFVDGLLPIFKKGFAGASTQVGGFFGDLASDLKTAFQPTLKGMFADLDRSVGIFGAHTSAIANIVTRLGQQGAKLLPRLADYVGTLADRFSAFLDRDDNMIGQWIENGIQAATQLGHVLKNVWDIFSGINDAAKQAGGATLGIFADTLGRISRVVNSPAFQTSLVSVLQAAFEATHQIGSIAGPALTNLVSTLAQTATVVLPTLGKAVGTLGSALATALASPAIQTALGTLARGIEQIAVTLAPGIAALAPLVGSIAGEIASFGVTLAPVITALVQGLAPALSAIFDVLRSKLIPALGGALLGVVQALVPALGPVSNALVTIIGAAGDLVAQLTPRLQPALTAMVEVAINAAPVLGSMAKSLDGLLAACLPLIKPLSDLFAAVEDAMNMQGVGQIIVSVASALTSVLAPAVKVVAPLIEGLAKSIQAITKAADWVKDIIKAPFKLVGSAVHSAMTELGGSSDDATDSLNSTSSATSALLRGLSNLPSTATAASSALAPLATSMDSTTTSAGSAAQSTQDLLDKAIALTTVQPQVNAALDPTSQIFANLSASAGDTSGYLVGVTQALSRTAAGAASANPQVVGLTQSLLATGSAGQAVATSTSPIAGILGNIAGTALTTTQAASPIAGVLNNLTSSSGVAASALSPIGGVLANITGAAQTTTGALTTLDGMVARPSVDPSDVIGGVNAALSSLNDLYEAQGQGMIGMQNLVNDFNVTQLSANMNATAQAAISAIKGATAKVKTYVPKIYNGSYGGGASNKAANAAAAKKLFDTTLLGQFLDQANQVEVNPLTTALNAIFASAKDAGKRVSTWLVTTLNRENAQLISLANTRESIAQKLSDAQDALQQAIADRDNERTTVASTYLKTFDITDTDHVGTTGTTILAVIKQKIAKVQAYGTSLKKLAALGLPADLLQQLAEAGPAAMPQVTGLLNSTPQMLADIKSAYAQLTASSAAVGNWAASQFYDVGVNTAQGLVNGLQSQQAQVNASIASLAQAMVNQIKATLGIHSPSRVFHALGEHTGQGLINGLESRYSDIESSLTNFGRRLSDGDLLDLTVGSAYDKAAVSRMAGGQTNHNNTLNYYASNGGLSSEEDLFAAVGRARSAWG